MVIIKLYDHFIDAEILTGAKQGNRVFLPRISLNPSDNQYPFVLKRRQFPVSLAFAITINKSQGQTFDEVGILLVEPVFSHGQLYVALSRSKSKDKTKIFICESNVQGNIKNDGVIYTKNVVYKEILD